MITVLEGYPDDVLAVSFTGTVTANDYETVLVPETSRRVDQHGSIRLLCQMGPEFEAMAPGAMWSDTKLGLSRWSDFERLAFVSDVVWLRDAIMIFAPVLHYPVRTFANAELAQARAWVLEGK
ncbi:STAS/SEC14 domain-containing protein [Hoeflea sp.]|uniref:STAS/SEC14 domain-containing protein n=1 Tax=Hoeflea sp. TaxID=1940281 RepID=UPI002AFEA39D|nr:STAS/SEC14 domain-containing protein [Hoeflea sp.]